MAKLDAFLCGHIAVENERDSNDWGNVGSILTKCLLLMKFIQLVIV